MRLKTATGLTQDSGVLEVLAQNGFATSVADGVAGDIELSIGLSSHGTFYYVNPNSGNDTNNGLSWDGAFLTMAAAFAAISSGDTIFFKGKIKEQLTAPTHVFDITIVGASNRPRHADAAPVGSESGATWTTLATPATTTPLLTLQHQGWRLVNFVMAGPSASACVLQYRDNAAGEAEKDSSHAEYHNIRFASGRDGIEDSGGCYNIGVFDCTFHDLTGWAIKHTAGAGVADAYRWQIKGNRFQGCSTWIGDFHPHQWEITDNTVGEITTPGLLTGGGSGHNVIVRNVFDIAAASFDPVGGFTGHATDVWSNYLTDAIETGLPAN